MSIPKKYFVIGLMSGSSLDGIDLVYAEINLSSEYTYKILAAEHFSFSAHEKNTIQEIKKEINKDYASEHLFFSEISAQKITSFIDQCNIKKIDFIATHGHTILHNPVKKKTVQITDGQKLADVLHQTVICNFRQKDILAGGQGAPLVPIADQLFFSAYSICINIGGIANISFEMNNERIGYDICGANQILNYFAEKMGMDYDAFGNIAKEGKVNTTLFKTLNKNPFFKIPFPKSLDNVWVFDNLILPIQEATISIQDKLATATHHIAFQISKQITMFLVNQQSKENDVKILITGGGAFNTYLIDYIQKYSNIKIDLPEKQTIAFKEALAMCLMGVLRFEDIPNFIPSVTGAFKAVSGGDIFIPNKMHTL